MRKLPVSRLVGVLEVLYPKAHQAEREAMFTAFLRSLESSVDPSVMERALKIFSKPEGEFPFRLLALARSAPMDLPTLETPSPLRPRRWWRSYWKR